MVEGDDEVIESFGDFIHYLESQAKHLPYLDDYPILVVDESTKPFIIMNIEEFKKLQRKVLGDVDGVLW